MESTVSRPRPESSSSSQVCSTSGGTGEHCEHMLRIDVHELTRSLSKPWMQTQLSQRQLCCQHPQECSATMPALWICTQPGCCFRGCAPHMARHSKLHSHPCSLHLSTGRVRCSICERSVPCEANVASWLNPAIVALRGATNTTLHILTGRLLAPTAGRRGFKNMGNTCFLSAALHALSNCPPLSRYATVLTEQLQLTAGCVMTDICE